MAPTPMQLGASQSHGTLAGQKFYKTEHHTDIETGPKMEQHFQVAVLVLAFCLVYAILFRSRKSQLPPSPPSLPVIGHLHLLGKLPHQSLLKLAQQYGGLMYLRLGAFDTVVASSPAAAKEVLKTHDHVFPSRPAASIKEYIGYKGAGLVWAPYGEHWRNMRKLCTLELLSPKRVETSQPTRKFEMSVLLNDLFNSSKARSVVNLTTKLSDLTFSFISRMVMNKSYSAGFGSSTEREQALFFKDTIAEVMALASVTHIGDFLPYLKWTTRLPRIQALQRHLDEFLHKEIAEHRKRLEQGHVAMDFIDTMLSSNGALSDTSIKTMALDMTAGGTDTSAVTVEWALAELIRHPTMLKKAQQELKDIIGEKRTLEESDITKLNYLQAVLKETFRLHPAGPLLFRESTEACKTSDYTIPAKARAIVNVYAIGRDASVWEDPLKFNPDRFLGGNDIDVRGQNFELLPFGSGRRMCPGVLLGLTTVQFVLGSLLHAFDWEMPDGCEAGELDMSEEFGLTLPRRSPLMLIPSARLLPEAYEVEIWEST